MNVETVCDVLEDVVGHAAPRVLDEHADAHEDAVEEVFLHLENRNKSKHVKTEVKPLDAPSLRR